MKFLHVGCGHNDKTKTTDVFAGSEWQEVRLDIDEKVADSMIMKAREKWFVEEEKEK